ncbi:hypothetical protein GJ699_23105 [Duganella sp. FT80W]|uniref:TonB-dependent receptor n=1 Tax=Duganella guangzhouensis TaxID=2666084 RepID=A0A6I2L423_9BURK|nr:hypothetical protein [Duganella guangzhouensis]MRW92891.1 hypothetical protein [Duganella guangzhouensis]
MNIAKNMEVIFVAAAIIGAATSFATASERVDFVMPASKVVAVAQADTSMPTVTITAKRLTAAEKAAL